MQWPYSDSPRNDAMEELRLLIQWWKTLPSRVYERWGPPVAVATAIVVVVLTSSIASGRLFGWSWLSSLDPSPEGKAKAEAARVASDGLFPAPLDMSGVRGSLRVGKR
eukprot:c40739_g1_i1.p1 GENE.c40739_g1_i1~~c40739_g1_i1.p1  ORF type:complete len:108 (-),score=8.38 c40739_g1_i1:167-490(-)